MSAERLREVLHYDPETGIITWKAKTGPRSIIGGRVGSINSDGAVCMKVLGKFYTGHRLAFLLMLGAEPVDDVDHINLHRSDNSWLNLRPATRSQNCANKRARVDNASKLKGVCWHKASNKWCAQITKNGKTRHLGLFETKETAYAAYVVAARLLFSEFARAA